MALKKEPILLSDLVPGDQAEITGFDATLDTEMAPMQNFLHRLFEVGFLVGETIEVLHQAPFTSDPISVRVKDATYALRREDAALIQVIILPRQPLAARTLDHKK